MRYSTPVAFCGCILAASLIAVSPLSRPARAEEKSANQLTTGTKPGQEWSGNSLKMKFCWCPPGRFMMGSPSDELYRLDHETQVSVNLSRGFWLGKYEVTQGEWKQLMGTTLTEQRDKADKTWKLNGEGDLHPMYLVNHDEAQEFCKKLTKQDRAAGRLPEGWEYRLPTEAQWENACRAGTTTPTAFGDTLSKKQANFCGTYPFIDPTQDLGTKVALPVGSFPPNAWGLCDMHGNVWEWCSDWYVEQLPGGTDPEVTRKTKGRVNRGGCWGNEGRFCRSANRVHNAPMGRGRGLGFRVAAIQVSP